MSTASFCRNACTLSYIYTCYYVNCNYRNNSPANYIRSPSVGLVLGRRRPNTNPTLGEHLVFAGRVVQWAATITTGNNSSECSPPLEHWCPLNLDFLCLYFHLFNRHSLPAARFYVVFGISMFILVMLLNLLL